jgi:hypothetical protein
VSLCATAILDGWDTPIQERVRIVQRLTEHATGDSGAGDMTQVSAAKALIDVSVKKAALEQAERLKRAAPPEGDQLEDTLRRALDEAADG